MKYWNKGSRFDSALRVNISRKCLVHVLNIILIGFFFSVWAYDQNVRILKHQNISLDGACTIFGIFSFRQAHRNKPAKCTL